MVILEWGMVVWLLWVRVMVRMVGGVVVLVMTKSWWEGEWVFLIDIYIYIYYIYLLFIYLLDSTFAFGHHRDRDFYPHSNHHPHQFQ